MILGFITDIHEDITSLQKAFKLLEQEKVDSIICLGDIIGFALPFYKNIPDRDADSVSVDVFPISFNSQYILSNEPSLADFLKIHLSIAIVTIFLEWHTSIA